MGLGSIVEQRKRKALEDPVKNIARSTNVRPRRGLKVPMFEIPKKCTAPAYADGWTLSGVSTPAAVAAPRCFS